MKILVTAFDPFGGEKSNPAELAVRNLPDALGDIQISKLVVPTVFYKSIEIVSREIENVRPDAVLCIGQAGGRAELSLERVAINLDDARIPDNEGNQPIDSPIVSDGPAAYFSTLPIKAITRAIRESGIPAGVSNSAGTFVCNHLMYGVLHTLATKYPKMRGGFMHVPFAPDQVACRGGSAPSMSISDIGRGIQAAIQAIAKFEKDIPATEGKTH